MPISANSYITYFNEFHTAKSVAKTMTEHEWKERFLFVLDQIREFLDAEHDCDKYWTEYNHLKYLVEYTTDTSHTEEDIHTSKTKWLTASRKKDQTKKTLKEVEEAFASKYPECKSHKKQTQYFISLYKTYLYHQDKGAIYPFPLDVPPEPMNIEVSLEGSVPQLVKPVFEPSEPDEKEWNQTQLFEGISVSTRPFLEVRTKKCHETTRLSKMLLEEQNKVKKLQKHIGELEQLVEKN
jgi:hypothetical protein